MKSRQKWDTDGDTEHGKRREIGGSGNTSSVTIVTVFLSPPACVRPGNTC